MSSSAHPNVQVVISANSNVLHLSGSPPFVLRFTLTSHESQPITIHILGTILAIGSALHQLGFDFIDAETKKKVWRQSAFPHRRRPPPRTWAYEKRFLTLEPEKTYIIEHTLGTASTSTVASDGPSDNEIGPPGSDANGLRKGCTYILRAEGRSPATEIRWWRYGTKEELLSNEPAEEEGLGWSEPNSIPLYDCGEVTFRVEE